MLEQLNFVLEEKLTVELKVKEHQLYYRVKLGAGEEALPAWTLMEGGRRWLRRLEKVHFGSWRANYKNENKLLPQRLWRLTVRDTKFGLRRVTGDQAYPDEWAAFIDLMNEVPGVSILRVRQLEQVSLILHDKMNNPGGNIYLPKQSQLDLTEKLIINRGKHILVFTRHKQGVGTERHAYDSARNVPILLARIAEHAADFRIQQDGLADDYLPQVEWKLLWRDGTEDAGSYSLKGQEMPEAWRRFMHEIELFTGNVRGHIF